MSIHVEDLQTSVAYFTLVRFQSTVSSSEVHIVNCVDIFAADQYSLIPQISSANVYSSCYSV